MAQNLQRNPTTTNLARLNEKDFDCTLGLENYVTRRSMCFFDLIEANGQKKAKSFRSQPPSTCLTDKNYTEMKLIVHELKVVNDTAQRGVDSFRHTVAALLETKNNCNTCSKKLQLIVKLFPNLPKDI